MILGRVFVVNGMSHLTCPTHTPIGSEYTKKIQVICGIFYGIPVCQPYSDLKNNLYFAEKTRIFPFKLISR